MQLSSAPARKSSQEIALLLVPTVLLAAAALMLFVRRRFAPGWAGIGILAVFGIVAWLVLRHGVTSTTSLSPAQRPAITWATLPALVYLLVIAVLVLRRPQPSQSDPSG